MLGFVNKKQNQPINMSMDSGRNSGYTAGQAPQSSQNNVPPQPQQNINNAEIEEYINRRNAEIDSQVKEFTRKNPQFDMRREIQNPVFCNYVWGNGLSVEDAYYLVHRNENSAAATNKAEAEPQKRISENGTGRSVGSGIVKKNPKDLSDDEIDEIVKRVRDGEMISF